MTQNPQRIPPQSVLSLFLAILGIHLFFLSIIVEHGIILGLSVMDFFAAIALAFKSKDRIGHAGLILGIIGVLICGLLL